MVTLEQDCRRVCLRGSYFSSFACSGLLKRQGRTFKWATDLHDGNGGIVRGYYCEVRPVVSCSARYCLLLEFCSQAERNSSHNPIKDSILPLPYQPQVIVAVVQHVCEGFRHPSTQTTLGGGDLLATSGLDCSHRQQIESSLVYKSILGES